MIQKSINFKNKFEKFNDYWSPKIISEMNSYQFKLVKVNGEFIWHKHTDTDETFIVIHGKLTIQFRDGKVDIDEGEMYVVPKNTEHKPMALNECHIMIIEPKGVKNTGNKTNADLEAQNDIWI
tara:strand:- start:848 stop:1216 length:369 start_codon:yes stop_codon:yes gene_type:complete